MSLWSSIKSVGRAIDPTNKNAPLGQTFGRALDAAGSAFGIPPGTISGGLAMTGSIGASAPSAATPKAAPVDPLPAASSNWLKPSSAWGQVATSSTGLYMAAAAVLALVYVLARRK